MIMTDTISGDLVLGLIAVCAACALYHLARMWWPVKGLRSSPRGPSLALAILGFCAVMFLAIPATVVWGLIVAAILGACHAAGSWKTHISSAT
jgi:hypothetical protein